MRPYCKMLSNRERPFQQAVSLLTMFGFHAAICAQLNLKTSMASEGPQTAHVIKLSCAHCRLPYAILDIKVLLICFTGAYNDTVPHKSSLGK